jgi:3-oxoacyl-(acyl-carrier-protein) synthase III
VIPARILGTGSAIAGRAYETRALAAEAFPRCEPEDLEIRTGIRTRYWVEPGTTAASLGAQALSRALDAAGIEARALKRIILVTSTGGDHLVPATANDVAAALSLDGTCDAFDLNNSCVGFLSAFDLAARSVATGLGPVGIAAVETFSRHLSPLGARAYVTLGDGAAAAVLGRAEGEEGLLASVLKNSANLRGRLDMPLPGTPGARPYHDFSVGGRELGAASMALLKECVAAALDVARCSIADVAWWLPHQPNGGLVKHFVAEFQLDPGQLVSVVEELGSIGSASVPVSLDRLFRGGSLREGQHLVMASVGAGMASGAIVYRVGRQ